MLILYTNRSFCFVYLSSLPTDQFSSVWNISFISHWMSPFYFNISACKWFQWRVFWIYDNKPNKKPFMDVYCSDFRPCLRFMMEINQFQFWIMYTYILHMNKIAQTVKKKEKKWMKIWLVKQFLVVTFIECVLWWTNNKQASFAFGWTFCNNWMWCGC